MGETASLPRSRAGAAAGRWHTLTPEDVESALGTTAEGLPTDAARSRHEQEGPNELEPAPPPSALETLLHQFRSPLIYILLLATVITLLLGHYIDSGVIAVVLALNAVIGFTQERRAEQSVRALMQLMSPSARVVRDGREREIESRELVPGDLVLLESGARVPADLRLIATTGLRVDESLLTGESVAVTKRAVVLQKDDLPLAERTNMAYTGTVVSTGRARGYVVAIGPNTELGAIAAHVHDVGEVQTPLQVRMKEFAHFIGLLVVASSAAAFALGIAMGGSVSDMFMVAVALAVAAVPEGLPVVFTITLALGVRRMARRNAIIRSLPAVETLGSTTVIGSDKTGTLTKNRMTVAEIWSGGQLLTLSGDARPPGGDELTEPVRQTLLAGVLTNEAEIYDVEGEEELHGDPTEAALLVCARHLGVEPAEARRAFPVHADLPFEPERQYSATLRRTGAGCTLYLKGAPERVLAMCGDALGRDAHRRLDVDAMHAVARDMAARGLRMLGMACRVYADCPAREALEDPQRLTFLGLQGLIDPPREGVHQAIRGCQGAGIRVLMITGDHAETARAIGGQLGIASGGGVLTGRDFDDLSDEALRERLREVAIWARVAPEHKLRVVQALRGEGHVVAVTGDGVNDAPALKAADIGIAMGRTGTDVAREASDMVLADDNFVSIYAAVEEGRITFDNLRKVTFFLVSTGVGAILMILAALLLGWPVPLVAAQILWLNLVTNGLQDVALAFEPGEPGVLARPPRSRDEGVMSRLLWARTALAGGVMAAGTLWLFHQELNAGGSLVRAQSVALTTMVLFQVFHVGNSRSEFLSVFQKSPFSNPFLFIATAAAVGVHVLALHLPATQFILRVEPLPVETWGRMILVAVSIVVAMELHKLLTRPTGTRTASAPA